jgi:tRNA (mo5U34)-methyltransferase
MTEKLKKIMSYPLWRQRIELGDGYVTTGRVNQTFWKALHFPEDVKGKSFLDIGANDGLFSFMAEQKGAAEVVASDLYKDSIGSMEDGWSDEGIQLLKDYFDSKISIHKNGIYHLEELNKTFDLVLVNHIINWLDDIELAIKKLALATKGTLYISDGFLLESNPVNRIAPKDMPIRSLYKSSYIILLLEKNGFKIDALTEINYQHFFIHDFVNYPIVKLKENTKVYQLPEAGSEFKLMGNTQNTSYFRMGDFYHVFQLGWVHKDDAIVNHYTPSKAYKISKAIGMLKLYYSFLNSRFKKKNGYTYFMIKATKV